MSDPRQNPRSPDQQFNEIDREVARAGSGWVCVGDYRDDGVSGRYISKRPGFSRMLQDIKTGEVITDLVLVDTLERFGRLEELDSIRRELRDQHGVLVLTADSHFVDPTSVSGKALGFVESLRASSAAQVKAHNVLRGKRDAVKRGRWPGAKAPMGYQLESVMKDGSGPAEVDYRRLIPDPRSADVVKRIFRLADEKGLGTIRIAKVLNAEAEFVEEFGNICSAQIGRILDNSIYKGTMRFGYHATDVVNDHRIARRNAEKDVLLVDGFCEPLVSDEVWTRVNNVRRLRGKKIMTLRDARKDPDLKMLKPRATGLVVKYPLTGLVCCGICGSNMVPNRCGAAYRRRFYYLRCPLYHDGRCSNKIYVRGDWLWRVVIVRLRERLFPLPDNNTQEVPDWLAELVAEVRTELARLAERDQDRRPLLRRELTDIDKRIVGWTQSLAKSDLSGAVRSHIENQMEDAMRRKQEVETKLDGFENQTRHAASLLDVQGAIERLRRLDSLLASGNPTEINVELARHIDEIVAYPDRRITMRTCRLGVFEGLGGLLSGGSAGSEVPAPVAAKPSRRPLRCRRIPPAAGSNSSRTMLSAELDRPVQLPEKWTTDDEFMMPDSFSWTAIHANDVSAKHAETNWTKKRLAEHFGVSVPTIRRALKLAAGQA